MNNVIIVYIVYFIVKAIYLKVIYMKFHKIEIQSTVLFFWLFRLTPPIEASLHKAANLKVALSGFKQQQRNKQTNTYAFLEGDLYNWLNDVYRIKNIIYKLMEYKNATNILVIILTNHY